MKKRTAKYGIMSIAVIVVFSQMSMANYNITFNSESLYINGSGTGFTNTWYYYPHSDRYIMWFPNMESDPLARGDINWAASIVSVDKNAHVGYTVTYGWSLETWNNSSTPPLPSFIGSITDERTNFQSKTAFYSSGTDYMREFESHTINKDVSLTFGPLWAYIGISGKNIYMQGAVTIGDVNTDNIVTGACCNASTGDCYITDLGACNSGFTYLGDGTTCLGCLSSNPNWDFGDAPPPYPVLSSQGGAQHTISADTYLGSGVTSEAQGNPSANANTDLYDDGVLFLGQVLTGQSTPVQITASKLGVVSAWLDLNADGDWADAGEQILVDEPVIQGQNNLPFFVPATATTGLTFARFRYNSIGGLSYSGLASDGEVEDYALTISTGTTDPTDPVVPPATISPIPPTNQFASKWFQPVDILDGTNFAYGWNLITRQDSIPLLADDWTSGNGLPIQGLRWWGTFDNWLYSSMPTEMPAAFHIAIWTNNRVLNKPNTMIWEHTSYNWSWAYTGRVQDAQGQVGGESIFEFTSLFSQDEWFTPSENPNTVYWLSVVPVYNSSTISSTPWGWMTRQTSGSAPAERILGVYNPSQWPPVLGAIYTAGSAVTYPSSTQWDVAFELITSQPGGGSAGNNSELANAIGDLNDDGTIDINDLYILLGFVLNP